ncbi:MAG: helix-turn-helix domain-containing protein [Nitrosomonas sp.]|nr:helix-turn-helix domain-containing protein [Nitrosomonas sp.]
MYNQIFLTNIARILDELKMTKLELAEKAGISVTFLSGVTLDRANPSLRIMEAIANALQTPLPILLEQTTLSEEDMNELRKSEAPRSSLPKGLVHACGVLTEYQAYQVSLWNAENQKRVSKNRKLKIK